MLTSASGGAPSWSVLLTASSVAASAGGVVVGRLSITRFPEATILSGMRVLPSTRRALNRPKFHYHVDQFGMSRAIRWRGRVDSVLPRLEYCAGRLRRNRWE